MNMAEKQPVLMLSEKFWALPGSAYGVEQSTMLGFILVNASAEIDLAALERTMQSSIGHELPKDAASESGKSLLDYVAGWYLSLQQRHSLPVFGHCHIARPTPDREKPGYNRYLIGLPYARSRASIASLKWLVETINWLSEPSSLMTEDSGSKRLEKTLTQLAEQLRPYASSSTNLMHFLRAAHRLRIQSRHLNDETFVLGLGFRNRWLDSSITDSTPCIAVRVSKFKDESANILRQFGIPSPHHILVGSAEKALSAAEQLRYPVVVKPNNQDQGRGVFAGLHTRDAVLKAFEQARSFSDRVLIERHYFGEDYRFTVFQERVVKIMHRRPGGVRGDGERKISDLLTEAQSTPESMRAFRRDGKMRLMLDEEARELLEEQQLCADSIPAKDVFVPLRRKSNISAGGTYSIVPVDQVHRDNCTLAIRAARVLGLDFAGIDLIISDVTRPWHECGGVICEINAQPQIGIRDTPKIYEEILKNLVDSDGHIPCHLFLFDGEQDGDAIASFHELANSLGCNAITTSNGAWLEGEQCIWSPENGFKSAIALLSDRKTRAILIVMRPIEVVEFGLPTNRLDSIRMPPKDRMYKSSAQAVWDTALRMIEPHLAKPAIAD